MRPMLCTLCSSRLLLLLVCQLLKVLPRHVLPLLVLLHRQLPLLPALLVRQRHLGRQLARLHHLSGAPC